MDKELNSTQYLLLLTSDVITRLHLDVIFINIVSASWLQSHVYKDCQKHLPIKNTDPLEMSYK